MTLTGGNCISRSTYTGRNWDGSLQIMYGIVGRHNLSGQTLTHLSGHRDRAPVRRGNGTCDQLQLDIYGDFMDSVYLCAKDGSLIWHASSSSSGSAAVSSRTAGRR